MHCKNCGARLENGAFFCVNCGIKLEKISNSKTKNSLFLFFPFVLVFFLIILGFFLSNHKKVESKKEKLELNDISLTYESSKWIRMISQETENAKILQNMNVGIALTYDTSDYYYTTETFASKVKKYYEELGYTILEEIEPVIIHGETWHKLVYIQDNYKVLQLFFSNNYDTYSFVYKVNSSEYDKYLQDAKDIYETLTFDRTKKIESEKEVKIKLIGEWDWGISGYFVIEEDKVYLYKDSTKSMDNVYYGTYEADNKVKTYASGYKEGMYILMTIEKASIDGEEPSLGTTQIEFVFLPNEDGTYTISNLYTGSKGIGIKVK